MVKNLPAVQETWISSLDQKDPLEKGMATHSLVWKIAWTEEPDGLQRVAMGMQSQTQLNDYTFTFLDKNSKKNTYDVISLI